ncbi:MAG TPA: hypothetical protein VF099_01510 [Ktedonobacterales bacterium]
MNMTLSQQATSTQVQQTQLWLVTANRLLVVSSDELHTLLQEEVAANPALELEERAICPACGRALQGPRCTHCLAPPSTALGTEDPVDQEGFWLSAPDRTAEEAWDMLAEHVAPVNLKDTLMLALQAELPAEAEPIIEYLVGNLDEDGYLRCTVEEAASVLQVDVAQVEQVLIHLQAQEPSGVGARTVRECLLLQLRALEMEGRSQPYAYEIVDRFLEPLAQRKYALIARELGIHRQQVEQVGAFLKQQLTPFPASQYVREASGGSRYATLVPQVVIHRQSSAQGNRYTVEVVEAERFHMQINPVYLEVYREVQGKPDCFQAADRAHLQRHVGYARLLLLSLHKRWQTLGRITQHLVNYQQAFLEQGYGALRPLTRAQVATALGVHPSTVSRAMADKYVLLPDKRVAPFSIFFEANLPIKEALKEILTQETKPLSDQRLTKVLAARGHQVARRTLTKYRAELRVPASLCR